MLATIASSPAAAAPRPAAAPAPPPAPAPAPAPPQDGIDFTTIDTPVKAALLPILDPAVLANIVAGAVVTGMGGSHASAYIDASLVTGPNATPKPAGQDNGQAFVNYIVDPSNQKTPLIEGGIIGPRFNYNALTVDQQQKTAHLAGAQCDLTFKMDESDRSLHLDGKLGTVDTHLTMRTVPQTGPNPGNTFAVHAEGALNDQAYSVDTVLTGNAGNNWDRIAGSIRERGKLGGGAIRKDYTFTAVSDGKGSYNITTAGGGTVAGIPEAVNVALRVSQDAKT